MTRGFSAFCSTHQGRHSVENAGPNCKLQITQTEIAFLESRIKTEIQLADVYQRTGRKRDYETARRLAARLSLELQELKKI